MFIWISLALYVYEFWENVHPYMLIRSYTAIRDLEVEDLVQKMGKLLKSSLGPLNSPGYIEDPVQKMEKL